MLLALVVVGSMIRLAGPMGVEVVEVVCGWYDWAMEESIEVVTWESPLWVKERRVVVVRMKKEWTGGYCRSL